MGSGTQTGGAVTTVVVVVAATAGLAVASPSSLNDTSVDGTFTFQETQQAEVSTLDSLVPTAFEREIPTEVPSWPAPCEEMFLYLAEHDPPRLLSLIAKGELTAPQLTFAAEHAGLVRDRDQDVVDTLQRVLSHPKAFVREGAVYGLALIDHEDARALLERVAEGDADADVRVAAAEALEE